MSEKCHLPEVLNRTRRERGTPIGLSETTDGTEEDEQKQRKKCLLLRAHPFLFLRYHSQSDAPWLWPTTGVWCCLAVEKDAATAHALRFQLMSHESSPVVNEYESTSLALCSPSNSLSYGCGCLLRSQPALRNTRELVVQRGRANASAPESRHGVFR